MKYAQRYDNEWVETARHTRIACCDCGLVHDFVFRVRNGRIEFRASRNARATAGKRRTTNLRVVK
jgi:hypothetical protein